MEARLKLMECAAQVVAAYVANNTVAQTAIPQLIADTARALSAVIAGDAGGAAAATVEPAVSIGNSVMPDYIVCLEDGRKFKSLKRHLRARYGLTPEQYREKWKLPADYPMVAPRYAEERSSLAKRMGLGQRGR
jgi:predicted transcriptional regulator